MSSHELTLTWDDHHNTLVKVLGKLLRTSSLVDCTIAAEGQYIKAHKIILSACSPYFKLLFKQENEKNPIVVLKDVKFQELKAIIDFIYSGKVRVPENRLEDFLEAAESLQIKGLGGDNYKTPSSGKISEGSGSPHPAKHEFSVSSSPFRRKRCRPISINEDNVSEVSSGTYVNDGCQSIYSASQGQMKVGRLGHQIGQHSSTGRASNRLCSASVTVHSEQRTVETDSPASFAEPSPVPPSSLPPPPPPPSPPPPPPEILPRPDTMVIEAEPELAPEPIVEVILPEMDFEPEGEDVEDTVVLDSESEVSGAVLKVDTLSSSSHNTGVVKTYARGGRRHPPATTMRPAVLTLGGVLESSFRPPADADTAAAVDADVAAAADADVAAAAAAVSSPPPVDAPGRSSGQSAQKRRSCPVCSKTYASLTVHMRTHTGVRPFICSHCSRAFTQMCALQRHQLTHTCNRSFMCELCAKAFKRRADLQTHQRIHTGERPYRCDECGATMTQMSNLYQHLRCVHGISLPKRRVPARLTVNRIELK